MKRAAAGLPALGLVLAFLLLAPQGVEAQNDLTFKLGETQRDAVGIGKFLLGLIMLCLFVAGAYVIVQGLVEARQKGGWSHFLWGVGMVMIALFAFFTFLKIGGHNTEQITQQIQIK